MSKQSLTDLGIGGSALTVPLWVQHLEAWAQAVVLFGSAILVVARLVMLARHKRED